MSTTTATITIDSLLVQIERERAGKARPLAISEWRERLKALIADK